MTIRARYFSDQQLKCRALELLSNAVDKGPNSSAVRRLRRMLKGRIEVQALEGIVAQFPHDAIARPFYERLIELDSANVRGRLGLARLDSFESAIEKDAQFAAAARAHFEVAKAAAPNDREVLWMECSLAEDREQRLAVVRRMWTLFPGDPGVAMELRSLGATPKGFRRG